MKKQKQTEKKLSLKKLQITKINHGLNSIRGGSHASLSFDDQTTGGTIINTSDKPKDTITMGYV